MVVSWIIPAGERISKVWSSMTAYLAALKVGVDLLLKDIPEETCSFVFEDKTKKLSGLLDEAKACVGSRAAANVIYVMADEIKNSKDKKPQDRTA